MTDRTGSSVPESRDDLAALWPVVTVLQSIGVSFHVGGSMASSIHGVARTTLVIDVVAALREEHIEPIVNALSEGDSRVVPVLSAEDVILHKLRWFRDGGASSERQWTDILGVMRVQHDLLDRVCLEEWADTLELRQLLDRAINEA